MLNLHWHSLCRRMSKYRRRISCFSCINQHFTPKPLKLSDAFLQPLTSNLLLFSGVSRSSPTQVRSLDSLNILSGGNHSDQTQLGIVYYITARSYQRDADLFRSLMWQAKRKKNWIQITHVYYVIEIRLEMWVKTKQKTWSMSQKFFDFILV